MAKQKGESDLSLKQVLLRRGKDISYTTVPTRQEGVSLRVEEEGRRPRFTIAALGELAVLGKFFAEKKESLRQLNSEIDGPKKTLKEIAFRNIGFRGIESLKDKFAVHLKPIYSIDWDFDRLRKYLGPAYESLVTESLQTNILIPLGRDTKKGPLDGEMVMEAISKSFLSLGFDSDELSDLVTFEQISVPDEVKIGEMVADGQLKMIGRAGKVALSFAVEAGPLE